MSYGWKIATAGSRARVAGALAPLLLLGCAASAPAPQVLTPQTLSRPATAEVPPPPPSEPPVAAAVKDDTTIVIDPGEDTSGGPKSLLEAAEAERQRREVAGTPVAVITNDSLPRYHSAPLTVAQPGPDTQPTAAPAPAAEETVVRDEPYWRARVLAARLRWRDAAQLIADRESELAALRRRFYAEDDPYYRDTQIKPALDRTQSELAAARLEVEKARVEVERVVEEGRIAGALPGWLREGIDQEPPPPPPPVAGPNPREPVVIDEDPH